MSGLYWEIKVGCSISWVKSTITYAWSTTAKSSSEQFKNKEICRISMIKIKKGMIKELTRSRWRKVAALRKIEMIIGDMGSMILGFFGRTALVLGRLEGDSIHYNSGCETRVVIRAVFLRRVLWQIPFELMAKLL